MMLPKHIGLMFALVLTGAFGAAWAQSTKVDADILPSLPLSGVVSLNGAGEPTHVTTKIFRHYFPAPVTLDAVVSAYGAAATKLLGRAQEGLRTDVSLRDIDGAESQGYDEYFSSSPQRFREVRGATESIIVGDVSCSRKGGASFQCDKIDLGGYYNFGLRKLVPEAIVSTKAAAADCGGETCHSYVIVQADDVEFNDARVVTAKPQSNYTRIVLMVRQDGLPYSLDEAHFADGKQDTPAASSRFAYDKKVVRFDLPKR